jgi:hypothetical protein
MVKRWEFCAAFLKVTVYTVKKTLSHIVVAADHNVWWLKDSNPVVLLSAAPTTHRTKSWNSNRPFEQCKRKNGIFPTVYKIKVVATAEGVIAKTQPYSQPNFVLEFRELPRLPREVILGPADLKTCNGGDEVTIFATPQPAKRSVVKIPEGQSEKSGREGSMSLQQQQQSNITPY